MRSTFVYSMLALGAMMASGCCVGVSQSGDCCGVMSPDRCSTQFQDRCVNGLFRPFSGLRNNDCGGNCNGCDSGGCAAGGCDSGGCDSGGCASDGCGPGGQGVAGGNFGYRTQGGQQAGCATGDCGVSQGLQLPALGNGNGLLGRRGAGNGFGADGGQGMGTSSFAGGGGAGLQSSGLGSGGLLGRRGAGNGYGMEDYGDSRIALAGHSDGFGNGFAGGCGHFGCGTGGKLCLSCRLRGLMGGRPRSGGGLLHRATAGHGVNDMSANHPYGGQIPHTEPIPSQMGMESQSPTYAYPYYTLRGPRDFLQANPPSIGY